MTYTTVAAHTRRGYQVRAHGRRTAGRHITEVLANDGDRVYGEFDREGRPAPVSPSTNGCPHPGWYPVSHVDGGILAWACTDCAASRPTEEVAE